MSSFLLTPLPVDEKAVSWTWCALAMGFSPLSVEEKAVSWTWCALAMDFPPACRGKGHLMDLVCARDGLYPLSVEEKSVSGHPGIPQRGPERSPKVARELPSQKNCIFDLDLLSKQCLFEQGGKY